MNSTETPNESIAKLKMRLQGKGGKAAENDTRRQENNGKSKEPSGKAAQQKERNATKEKKQERPKR